MTQTHIIRILGIFLTLGLFSACAPVAAPEPLQPERPTHALAPVTPTAFPTETPLSDSPAEPVLVFTHPNADGNRVLVGSGVLPDSSLEIPLQGKPLWIVAAPAGADSLWAVALENGQVQVFRVNSSGWEEVPEAATTLPEGMPPALFVSRGIALLLDPGSGASPFTAPILLPDGRLAFIRNNGQLSIDGQSPLSVNALPDARLLMDELGRILFLSEPTRDYPHAVLGDDLEATGITLVNTQTSPPQITKLAVTGGDVIEGIAPLWADLDGDGAREIIVTQSNSLDGARLVAYREDGSLLAASPAIGQGFRWRHQLAVGKFLPGDEVQIAVVRTPHIGGVIELFVLENGQLVRRAELAGYSTHQIYSRNLDSTLAFDLNADGILELLAPEQSQQALALIAFRDGVLRPIWRAELGDRLSTNLAGVSLAGGGLAFGIGEQNGVLRIWLTE